MFKKAVDNADTEDIIYSLCIAVPGAIQQAKEFNLPEIIGLQGANLYDDAILTGKWIRANVRYKIDEFGHQNIQFPSALLRNGQGDCKSLSLLYLSIMEAAGWNGGFRFASYKTGGNFTHVYNFFLDNQNNLHTFDACIKNLKEVNKYKKIKDMQVNYIAGAPTMIEETQIVRSQPQMVRKNKRYQIGYVDDIAYIGRKKGKNKPFKKLGKFIKKGFDKVKTVGLAPARGPFLALVNINFRGLARKLNEARQKGADRYQEWWTKIGGDIDKLNKAVDKGKDKKAFFGEKKVSGMFGANEVVYMQTGIGVEPVSTATLLTAAAGLIASASKLFSSLGIKSKKGEGDVAEGIDPDTPVSPEVEPGTDFFANDPASKEADDYATSGGVVKPNIKASTKGLEATSDLVGFKPSPLLIAGGIGAIALIFMLTKKGKK